MKSDRIPEGAEETTEEPAEVEIDAAVEDTSAKGEGEDAAAEGEFKLSVHKLELPIRPRGVLAE